MLRSHDTADVTSLLTCTRLPDLIIIMHDFSFPTFPAVIVEYVLNSQANKSCPFCHLFILATVCDVSYLIELFLNYGHLLAKVS